MMISSFIVKTREVLLILFLVPPPNRAYIRSLIHSGDLEHLEKVVLDGHGHKLLHETSALEKVTKFIYALPDFMVKYNYALLSNSLCSRNFQNVKLRLDFVEI